MSIQSLLPTGYTSLAQTLQRNASSKTDDTDPLGILSGSADAASSTDPVDLLFGGSSDDGSTDTLASFLGSSSDSKTVFDSFTDEAKAALLQAQEESQDQSSTGDAADPATAGSSNSANDPLVQALAALLSPAAQSSAASRL